MHSATGGDDSLIVWSDAELRRPGPEADLAGEVVLRAGERIRLLIAYSARSRSRWSGPPPTEAGPVEDVLRR